MNMPYMNDDDDLAGASVKPLMLSQAHGFGIL